MRFNKLELLTLATQPSQKFDKEGILFLRERQEGFFRRTERTDSKRGKGSALRTLNCYGGAIKVNWERWCRLRGNLLFYFKSRDQWSEPMGVIVLEQFTIRLDEPSNTNEMPFGFTLVFEGGMGQHMGTNSCEERDSWLNAIKSASYSAMRNKLHQLQERLETKRGHDPHLDVSMWRLRRNTTVDPNELPICEVSLCCDNLLCDGHGRPPNPVIIVHVYLPADAVWLKYANTEVIQRSSNPSFLSTVCFRTSDGLSPDSRIRFTAFDVRETVSQTATPIGSMCVTLSSLQDSERTRIPLKGNCGATVGFLSVTVWSLEREETNPSTESTPIRSISIQDTIYCHRRSQSLPPRFGWKLKLPKQGSFKQLFGNATVQTYRFHSGLGGDISVHEIMAESKLCFQFPQQLLSLWINEEKELLQEVAGMGELVEPWHSLQVELLDRHLQLLHLYSQAKENLQAHKGGYFKPSSRKHDRSLEFAPVNLHLQRMWVQNETLKKCGFYDIVTVGAFTAHSHRSKNGGLIKLLQQLKESPVKNRNDSTDGSSRGTLVINKISMAHDAIQAIKQIRKEVVDSMRTLMRLAKEKKTIGMIPICDDMIAKTRTLLSLWDPGLVEEALTFVEEHKVSCVTGDGADDSGVGGSLGTNSSTGVMSPFRRITQQLQLDQLMAESPPTGQQQIGGVGASPAIATILDDLVTPDSPRCLHTFWQKNNLLPSCGAHMNHRTLPIIQVQSQKRNSIEDESQFVIFPDAEEDDKKLSGTEIEETSEQSEEEETKIISLTNGHSSESEIGKRFLDTHAMCSSPSANYYKPTEEPEPWDLTQLNIEASVMCLVSKVKFLCGRCTSPAVRLRSSQRLVGRSQSFRTEFYHTSGSGSHQQREAVTLQPGGSLTLTKEMTPPKVGMTGGDERINQAVESVTAVRNKFTEGLELSTLGDWTSELRPSMRKLRQAMDGLLKTARLTHSVFRLQEDRRAAQRACNVRYRRHVCFSHALTSLVSALMGKFWCQRLDPMFLQIVKTFGPLVCFEGLLSYHGDEIDMWGDMVVAIEDLKTVTFTVCSTPPPSPSDDPKRCMPRVVGPRSSLMVVLPVPDCVYSALVSPLPNQPTATSTSSGRSCITFHVTPVFFNMGINEMATLAESLNATRPQEQSNVDNYLRLHEYYHRFRKLGLQAVSCETIQGPVDIKPQATLSNLMERLKAEVYASKSKNVRILQLTGHICRKMRGLRFTSCKSAKDRTGMSVTLEQANILSSDYDLSDHEFQKALDCMRSEGCRRENTSKNTGVRKYAFNTLQLLTLPKQYRPPAGTYGSAQS